MGILLSIISLLFEEMTFHKYDKLSEKLGNTKTKKFLK